MRITSLIPADVAVPNIQPDFSAPFFHGLKVLASYLLAGGIIVVLIIFIVAVVSLAFRGLAPDRVRSWAGENILGIFIAAAVLGGIGGIFQWFVNFNFGF